ncbi:hypothetical protein V2J09_004113 [Rumex salicifolius]
MLEMLIKMRHKRKRTNPIRYEALHSERSDASIKSYSTSPRPTHDILKKGRSLTPTSTTPHKSLPSNSVNRSVEDIPYKTRRTSGIPSQLQPIIPSQEDDLKLKGGGSCSSQNTQASCSSTSRGSGEHRGPLSADGRTPVRETKSDSFELGNEQVECVSKPSRSSNVKSKNLVLNWPDRLDFDEKEEVLTIDFEGKHMLLTGRVLPQDIDNLEVGIRCVVHFNEFDQPIRKGGSILAKYLGSLAKNKSFCPIGEKSWHVIDKQYKAKIIQVVRSKFVIPVGETFNRAILIRVSKHWRQYKHSLKKIKFDPKTRTKEEIFDDVPHGQTRDSWIHLVEYWYSQESQKLSMYGKKARASKSHVHTTGCTSYANKRADFVESNGRQPSHIEFFRMTHTHEGRSDDNAISSKFLVHISVGRFFSCSCYYNYICCFTIFNTCAYMKLLVLRIIRFC